MRSKWFWLARVRSKINLAESNIPYFGDRSQFRHIINRLIVLYIEIGNMRDRPEFHK